MMDCIDRAHPPCDLSGAPDAYPALRGPLRQTAYGADQGLRHGYRLEHYQADMQAMNAVASVHVEAGRRPGDPVGESAWLSSLADSFGSNFPVDRLIVTAADLRDLRRRDRQLYPRGMRRHTQRHGASRLPHSHLDRN